jgi:hypothetical protein
MCYEESFFQRWAKRRLQRHQTKSTAERTPPTKEPAKPTQQPVASAPAPRKDVERELEIV